MTAPPSGSPLFTYGLTGLKQASGFNYEEWETELSGDTGRRNLRGMIDTSPVVGAALMAVEILVRQVEWETIPADDSHAAAEVAEFIDGCCHDMDTSWEDFIGEHLQFIPWGWQWYELEYKLREGPQEQVTPFGPNQTIAAVGQGTAPQPSSRYTDGKYGWHRFGLRSQESLLRWEWSRDAHELLGMWQIPAPTYNTLYVPYAKSVNFRTTTRKDNPEGRSALRNSWIAWKFARNIMVHEGVGVERDLAGLPVAKVPYEVLQQATAEHAAAYQQYKTIVRDIRRDDQEGIVWPLVYDDNGNELYKLELLSTGGSRQFDTSRIISRYEQRQLMTFLADFLMIGTEGPGSRALIDPRINLFSLTGEMFLRQSAATINDRAITQLLAINGIDLALAPKRVPGRVNLTKLVDLASYVLSIAQADAASPLPPDVKQALLKRADLPVGDTGATTEDTEPNQPGE